MNPSGVFDVIRISAALTTVWLCLGLACAWFLRNYPARAHFALVLAVVGCVASPLLFYGVRQWNLGLMPAPISRSATEIQLAAPNDSSFASAYQSNSAETAARPLIESPGSAKESFSPSAAAISMTTASKSPADSDRSGISGTWSWLVLELWVILSIALLGRVVLALFSARRVLERNAEVSDPVLQAALDAACRHLGVTRRPVLRSCRDIQTPAIWCWGRRPTLLIPEGLLSLPVRVPWDGLLCHELSHWQRRDHVTSMIAELALVAFPWQPLVWVTRSFLRHFSELSCDKWVIAAGQSRHQYAQSLLDLAIQPAPLAVLPAVSTKRGLKSRIDQVLNGSVSSLLIGRRWSFGAGSTAIMIGFLLALLQSPTAVSQQNGPAGKDLVRGQQSSATGMAARRIEIRGADFEAGPFISPSGEYFCGFNSALDFYIGELASGRANRVWAPDQVRLEREFTAAWSRDSRQILISGATQVFLYGLETHKMEPFLEAPEGTRITIVDWSSDGDSLVGLKSAKDEWTTSSLVTVSYKTKAIRKLGDVQGYSGSLRPACSPDGKNVVFAQTKGGRATLHVWSLDGSVRLQYDEFLGNIESPMWSDDGKYILFKGAQNDVVDILALRFNENRLVGYPIVIQSGAKSISLLNAINHGQLAYRVFSSAGLYVVPMDPATTRPAGKLKRVLAGTLPTHSWSPNGKQLAAIGWQGSGGRHLWVIAADSGQTQKRIPLPNSPGIACMAWNGEQSVVLSMTGKGGRGLYRVGIDSENSELLMPQSSPRNFMYVSFGGMNRMAFTGEFGGPPAPQLQVVDFVAKRTVLTFPKEPYSDRQLARPAISADGEWITFQEEPKVNDGALLAGTKLWIASVTDGRPRLLYDFAKVGRDLNIHSWCPTGKFVSVIASRPKQANELWMVPVDGREPFQIQLPIELGEPWYPQWSPDGAQLSLHFFGAKEQYWVMENYLPTPSD